MLLYPPVNEIQEKVDSRYTLVTLAAKRARDIIDGKPPLLDDLCEREVSEAAREIMEDLITYRRLDPQEAEALEAERLARENETVNTEAVVATETTEAETVVEVETAEFTAETVVIEE